MRNLFLISLLFFSCSFIAQNNSLGGPKKSHFIIHSNNKPIPHEIQDAISRAQLDSLRFTNQSRLIPIDGGEFVLELYSGEELLKNYGRQTHPLNKNSETDKRNFLIQVAKGNLRVIIQ